VYHRSAIGLFDVHWTSLRLRNLTSGRGPERQVPLNNGECRVLSEIATVDITCMEDRGYVRHGLTCLNTFAQRHQNAIKRCVNSDLLLSILSVLTDSMIEILLLVLTL
jgi:hypothetical protein